MSHLDDVTIALRALGEHVGAEAESHLESCETCRAEVAALGRVTQAARAGGGREIEQPSTAVWDRVAAELDLPADVPYDASTATSLGDLRATDGVGGMDDGGMDDSGGFDAFEGARAVDGTDGIGGFVGAGAVVDADDVGGTDRGDDTDVLGAGPQPTGRARPQRTTDGRSVRLVDGADRWRRRTVWVAAASFVVGVAGTAVTLNLLEQDPQAPVVATAELEPLPGWEGSGTARVHEIDGRRVLNVELPEAGQSGYLEVWLLDAEVQRLVSLGVLSGPEGQFELPPDLDLGEFPIVDVSDEPYDGDPAHSGDSVVRGTLV